MTRHRHLRFAWTMALGLLCPAMCRPDPARITDPTRPVCELGRDYAILQWFTLHPTRTPVAANDFEIASTNITYGAISGRNETGL